MHNLPAVWDSFISNHEAVRQHALASEFGNLNAHDGETYERVCITEVPGLREAIEERMGPVEILAMGYRLNYENELPNSLVHSDLGWGTHALVLYLTDGPGGTAFWTHKATDTLRIDQGQAGLLERIQRDWNNADAWEPRGLVPMQLGRALIYESMLYHSRWPFAAFGSTPEDGRLIAVAFFNLRQ